MSIEEREPKSDVRRRTPCVSTFRLSSRGPAAPFDTRSAWWVSHSLRPMDHSRAFVPTFLVETGDPRGCLVFSRFSVRRSEDENLETRMCRSRYLGRRRATPATTTREDLTDRFSLAQLKSSGVFSTPLRYDLRPSIGGGCRRSVDLTPHSMVCTRLRLRSRTSRVGLVKLSDRGIVLFHDISEKKDDFGVWFSGKSSRRKYPFIHVSFMSHGLGEVSVSVKNLTSDCARAVQPRRRQRNAGSERLRDHRCTLVGQRQSRSPGSPKMERREQAQASHCMGMGTKGIRPPRPTGVPRFWRGR